VRGGRVPGRLLSDHSKPGFVLPGSGDRACLRRSSRQ
jgi:hypothetical protein